jgi:hypothetical protein
LKVRKEKKRKKGGEAENAPKKIEFDWVFFLAPGQPAAGSFASSASRLP